MNDTLAALIASLASHLNGSTGWAILLLALAVRIALLPLTLRLSRRMLANQQKMKALQPEVDAIKARLEDDPRQTFAAVSALYKARGVKVFDRSSLLGALVQWPVFALLYRAIGQASAGSRSFLWMKSLAAPDTMLAAIVLALTAVAACYFPSGADPSIMMVAVQVLAMAFVVWKLSAGLALYWTASSGVNVVQALVLRRDRRRAARPAGGMAV